MKLIYFSRFPYRMLIPSLRDQSKFLIDKYRYFLFCHGFLIKIFFAWSDWQKLTSKNIYRNIHQVSHTHLRNVWHEASNWDFLSFFFAHAHSADKRLQYFVRTSDFDHRVIIIYPIYIAQENIFKQKVKWTIFSTSGTWAPWLASGKR